MSKFNFDWEHTSKHESLEQKISRLRARAVGTFEQAAKQLENEDLIVAAKVLKIKFGMTSADVSNKLLQLGY